MLTSLVSHSLLPLWIPLRLPLPVQGDLGGNLKMDINRGKNKGFCLRKDQIGDMMDNSLKAHPSQDKGNACVWCDSWDDLSLPCMTAMPPSEPSKMRTGRRNEEMLQSLCIRPENQDRTEHRDSSCTSKTHHCEHPVYKEVKAYLENIHWFKDVFLLYSVSVSDRWEWGHWRRWWKGRS